MRTIKEDIVWPYDWKNPFDFEARLARCVSDCNTDFPSQAPGNLTPRQFYEKYVNKKLISNLKTPLTNGEHYRN